MLISQKALDLFPALLLMLRVCGQGIEDPGDATGCGVMALKHERVHFGTEVLVRQAAAVLRLIGNGDMSEFAPPSKLVGKASCLPCSHSLCKLEDVQEVQVPLAPDLLQSSLLLQLSLPQLDHSVCPRTVFPGRAESSGCPDTATHLSPPAACILAWVSLRSGGKW